MEIDKAFKILRDYQADEEDQAFYVALGVALIALERQREKPVEQIRSVGQRGEVAAFCPNCSDTRIKQRGSDPHSDYCSRCGQKLNWGLER